MFDHAPLSDHALMQDPAFARALRRCGQAPIVLPGGAILLHRRIWGMPVAMLTRAAPPTDLAHQLLAAGVARTPIILSPDVPCPLPKAIYLKRRQQRAVLELCCTAQAARARLHQKWRNQLSRAETDDVTVTIRPFDPSSDRAFLNRATDQARSHRYVQWPATLTLAFAETAPDQTHLLTAHVAGRTVAQMLFLTHGRQATYHIGLTSLVGRARHAHNLLLWQGARHLSDLEIETLDLGILHPSTTTLNRFKLRTGAKTVQTGGTWLYWHPFAARQKIPSAA